MSRRNPAFLAWAALLVCSALAQAQLPQPVGRVHPAARPLDQVALLAVGPLDRAAIAAEDAARDAAGFAPRFAIPNPVQATPATDGSWDILDADWALWRLRVEAPDADHVNLGFTRFFLPGDASLMVHGVDYAHQVRPFTAADHSETGELWTPVVFHHEIVVELIIRTVDIPRLDLEIGQVSSGYRFFGAGDTAGPQLDASGACNIDVVCTQGDPWRGEIPAIAAYSTGGSVFCTGFMVNNTAQDLRNFFMTAYHCGIRSSNASSIVVYWDYENTICNGPDNGTLTRFSTGAVHRAGWSTSDFTLVELNNPPDPAWGVTYVGWDRTGANASSSVAIHHPSGDPKKISFEYQATTTTSYLGTSVPGDSTHVRVIDWDLGTTEPGSSGSPLFDQNHRVIGQLHGGYAACGNDSSDWYGRFSLSWTGSGTSSTRLSDWLDAQGTGATTVDTLVPGNIALARTFGTGCVQRFATIAESFPSNGFDLAGTAFITNSILLTPIAGGYRVTTGSGTWTTPTSPDLNLSDDALSSTLALPFPFVHPGGSTTQVRMCSNGYVWLSGSATGTDYTPTVSELVSQTARLCPFWTDLNPASAGTTHFHVSAGVAYLTWLGVVEFGRSNTNDVQCAIFPDGSVEFRWRVAMNQSHTAIVGYSPGGGVAIPPSLDISAAMPFETGPDVAPLSLTPTGRPILGTTQGLTVGDIPAGSLAGAVYLGFGSYPQGIDLAVIGMDGCRQYVTLDIGYPVAASGPSSSFQLPIPPLPSLAGGHVWLQAITVSPGTTSLGVVTSNGVDLLLEQN